MARHDEGLPTGYNKDLQEDKEAVFESEYTLAVSLRAAHAVVSKLTVNAERSGRAASGLLLATDVADYLATHGMPFRRRTKWWARWSVAARRRAATSPT
jgi:argininosuccinate lyase